MLLSTTGNQHDIPKKEETIFYVHDILKKKEWKLDLHVEQAFCNSWSHDQSS